MIKKEVVKLFKRKRLEDYSFLKKFTLKEIKNEVNEVLIGKGFRFKTAPYKHQLVSFYIGSCLKQFLFLLDMGLGKTKILLDIIGFRKIKRTLVIVPSDINIEGWEEEISIHSKLNCVPMYGSTIDRWELVQKDSNIFVLNYRGLLYMCCKKNKKTEKLTIHKPSIIKLANLFEAILIDEIHKVKNNKILTFRVLNQLTNIIDVRYGATGTPFGRNPLDLWAIFYLIDKGETLGETLGLFKEAFFTKVFDSYGFPKLEFYDGFTKHLYRRLHNRSIRYSDSECQDLPKVISIVKHFGLIGPALKYYIQAVEGLIEADGDKYKIENSYHRMRQISSGFLQLKKDNGKNLPIIYFPYNPKLELLKSYCESLSEKRKMVIFLRYVPSGKIICDMLKELKFGYATSLGSTKKNKKAVEIKRFKKDSNCRFLVASIDGGAALGGNFQVANVLVFYESPESPIVRKQCVKRISRNKQKHRVRIIDLVAIAKKLSVEQGILDNLEEGENLFKNLLEGKSLKEIKNGR